MNPPSPTPLPGPRGRDLTTSVIPSALDASPAAPGRIVITASRTARKRSRWPVDVALANRGPPPGQVS